VSEQEEKGGAWSAIILLVCVLVVAGFSVKYGLQTLTWYEANRWASANPWLREVPKPLPASAAAHAPAAKATLVKTQDYQFNAPWAISKEAPGALYLEVRFAPGQVIDFFDPDAQMDTLRSLRNSKSAEYEKFTNVFADHPIDSNYALYSAVYGASPEQLSPWVPMRDAIRLNTLLRWKLEFGFDFEPPDGVSISLLELGKNRAFQFGDPAKGPVGVRVFDEHDRQFRLIFTVSAGSNAKITQDDVDMAVQSLKPIPPLER
jgi:hypothetical protein